jgi:energy-coupling factor transporter ATP-binding protein EcfA2
MNIWDAYPDNYRNHEIGSILRAVQAGESVLVVGLSGAGKSNLAGFLANRPPVEDPRFILADANRLPARTSDALYGLMRRMLGEREPAAAPFDALELAVDDWMARTKQSLCFVIDRFDELVEHPSLLNNLRALRDAYKYRLMYVVTSRRPLPPDNEFSELFLANTLWLGPLQESDARWNVQRYAARNGLEWGEEVTEALVRLSEGYPSILRAACEAHARGAELNLSSLASHPAVRARIEEFWSDAPGEEALRHSRLTTNPLLMAGRAPELDFDPAGLTSKEKLLLDYLLAHSGVVCDKDELIVAVWPEDQIYEEGVRDSSLAQLVRRLRQKIEPEPSNPRFIQSVPGRGYLLKVRSEK